MPKNIIYEKSIINLQNMWQKINEKSNSLKKTSITSNIELIISGEKGLNREIERKNFNKLFSNQFKHNINLKVKSLSIN